MVKEIAHLAFKVTDMEEAQDYYINKLGFTKAFEIKRKPDGSVPTADDVVKNSGTFDRDKVWIVYIQISPSQFLELFTLDEGEEAGGKNENPVGYFHLALLVDDIRATREELVSRGVEIDDEPKMGMDGTWQMWIHDPDGNKMEYMQYTEESAQIKYRQ